MPANRTRPAILLALLSMIVALAVLAIPLYVIRPFVPQSPRALQIALEVRILAPWLTILSVVVVLAAACWAWRSSSRSTRIVFVLAALLTLPTIVLGRINIFEKMFHPNLSPAFDAANQAAVAPADMVLAVTLAGQSRAYPIRTLGYHHIINDTLGGAPIAITYCTLCHTGLVWSRTLDGRILHFRLAGINNGNALLRDQETGSIWQQSSGESIFGHFRGQHLELVSSSELSFAAWRAENPNGQVLRPDPSTANLYDPPDWEQHVTRTHVVFDTSASGIDPHELMFALDVNNHPRVYPVRTLLSVGLIQEKLAGGGILLVVGSDNASIRAFNPGALTFVRNPSSGDTTLMTDNDSGSLWNFSGCAVAGKFTGHCLPILDGHKTFWFDWLNQHRDTTVYR